MVCEQLTSYGQKLPKWQVLLLCFLLCALPSGFYWSNISYMSNGLPRQVFFANTLTTRGLPVRESTTAPPRPSSRPIVRPCTYRKSSDGLWIRRPGSFYLFVYSAFYDDRPSLQTGPIIRIIVVSQDVSKRTMYCRMFYQNGTSSVAPVKALSIGFGVAKFHTTLKEYVYSCPLAGTEAPSCVSIVDSVTDPTTFQIGVEVPSRTSKKGKFAACVSVTYWRFDQYRIVEWMELQRLWGVEFVTIYNNSLVVPPATVFQHYADEGFIDFRQSHNFVHDGSETAIHLHMSPVINDCIYRNMHRFEWIVVVDLDEMIVPRQHDILGEMLAAVDASRKTPSAHPTRSYTFRNIYYIFDIPPDERQSRHLATMRYRRRLPTTEEGVSIKSIIDPQACTNMHNHYCWGYTSSVYGEAGDETSVNTSLAANQHYKKCNYDSYHNTQGQCAAMALNATLDDTMLRFKQRLIPRVNAQFKKLKMDLIH